MTEIISRKEAKARGLKRYFTGEPCKHGHVAERNYSDKKCIECKSGHVKLWRDRFPEKVKSSCKSWRQKNQDRSKELSRKNREENPERNKIKLKIWKKNNPSKVKEQRKIYKERRRQNNEFMENLAKEEFELLRQHREAELENARLEAEHDAYMADLEAGLKD